MDSIAIIPSSKPKLAENANNNIQKAEVKQTPKDKTDNVNSLRCVLNFSSPLYITVGEMTEEQIVEQSPSQLI